MIVLDEDIVNGFYILALLDKFTNIWSMSGHYPIEYIDDYMYDEIDKTLTFKLIGICENGNDYSVNCELNKTETNYLRNCTKIEDADKYLKTVMEEYMENLTELIQEIIGSGYEDFQTMIWYNGYGEIIQEWRKLNAINTDGIIRPMDNYGLDSNSSSEYSALQFIWGTAVYKFGDYGTSPRFGWIDNDNWDKFVLWIDGICYDYISEVQVCNGCLSIEKLKEIFPNVKDFKEYKEPKPVKHTNDIEEQLVVNAEQAFEDIVKEALAKSLHIPKSMMSMDDIKDIAKPFATQMSLQDGSYQDFINKLMEIYLPDYDEDGTDD